MPEFQNLPLSEWESYKRRCQIVNEKIADTEAREYLKIIVPAAWNGQYFLIEKFFENSL